MGRSVARLLAQKGAHVMLVARNIQRLEEALEHTTAGAIHKSQRFHFISADLTSSTEATRVLAETTAWNANAPPDIVWCCAGSAHPSLFIDAPISTFESQFSANYLTAVYIAHAALNLWLRPASSSTSSPDKSSDDEKQNTESPSPPPPPSTSPPLPLPRHIIFTSSILALYPLLGYAPYTPPKTALRSLTDTLSQELLLYPPTPSRPATIPHCIFPATILSPSYAEENRTKPAITLKLEEDDQGQTPEEVARESVRGLERGQEMVTTEVLGGLVWRTCMGNSRRGGWGVWDGLVGAGMLGVVGWVRWGMERTVRRWGRGEVEEIKPKGGAKKIPGWGGGGLIYR
ncbi:MAG: hypothetical protein Q9219_005622 [cf. Caloplaca sp. 3 TL-2023]